MLADSPSNLVFDPFLAALKCFRLRPSRVRRDVCRLILLTTGALIPIYANQIIECCLIIDATVALKMFCCPHNG
jgi:hypothetical protein